MDDKIGKIMSSALEDFKTRNKVFPKRVIVYRDGLGKGAHNCSKSQEFDIMKGKCSEKGITKFNFIITNKKVSVKFF